MQYVYFRSALPALRISKFKLNLVTWSNYLQFDKVSLHCPATLIYWVLTIPAVFLFPLAVHNVRNIKHSLLFQEQHQEDSSLSNPTINMQVQINKTGD